MKLLVLSSLFPSRAQPRLGIFTEHRVQSMRRHGGVEIRVIVPTPWFPFASALFGQYAAWARTPAGEVRQGLPVAYPRYLTIPKVGMLLQPFFMAAAMAPRLRRLADSGFLFDVIDAYYFYPDGVAATLLARHFNVPAVLTAYGSDINLLPHHAVPRRLIRWAANRADALTTVSQALCEELAALGAPREKLNVILNGVDLQLFAPPQDRAALRSKLGLDGPTLLAVGNLVRLKGHELMLRTLTLVPDVRLLVIGSGPEEERLQHQARALRIADRVRFLGHVEQSALPMYYGAADALLHTSTSEGIPNVLLEAMACGTPIIATNVGGVPEVVRTSRVGLLIDHRDPAAVAEAIRTLLADNADREAIRKYACEFAWSHTAAAHVAVLRNAIQRHASSGASSLKSSIK